MGNKWNAFFEKQALEDLKAATPPNPNADDSSNSDAEKAGEKAENGLNEPKDEPKDEPKNN